MNTLVKIENIETAGWQTALRGMRNPKESWDKSDTTYDVIRSHVIQIIPTIGPNDYKLAMALITAGSDHRKFLRQIYIGMDLSCAWGIWKEYATYKIGTVENSTSQMHKLGARLLTKDDFALDTWDKDAETMLYIINERIAMYQRVRDARASNLEQIWRDMLHLIPASFIYKRTCTLNYEVLRNMYNARKNHKQKEWRMILDILLNTIPYPEFITTK
jgi:hypothetical protein